MAVGDGEAWDKVGNAWAPSVPAPGPGETHGISWPRIAAPGPVGSGCRSVAGYIRKEWPVAVSNDGHRAGQGDDVRCSRDDRTRGPALGCTIIRPRPLSSFTIYPRVCPRRLAAQLSAGSAPPIYDRAHRNDLAGPRHTGRTQATAYS